MRANTDAHLGRVDPALLEGAVAGVLRAHVAVFAPVAGEVGVDTGQAPGRNREFETNRRGGEVRGGYLFKAIT